MTVAHDTFCSSHEEMVKEVSKMATSVGNIEKYIEEGKAWRVALASSIIAVALVLLIDLIVVAKMWGSLDTTVQVNSGRINILEDLHPRGK